MTNYIACWFDPDASHSIDQIDTRRLMMISNGILEVP